MYPTFPATAISTLLPENFDQPDSQPSLEIQANPEEVTHVVNLIREEYPWITEEEVLHDPKRLAPHIARTAELILQNSFTNIYKHLITEEAKRINFESMSPRQQALYLSMKNYCFGVKAFCESMSIDPSSIPGIGDRSREAIFINNIAEAENITTTLRQRRWETENRIFGSPLTTNHNKPRLLFFTDLIDFAGKHRQVENNSCVLINPKVILKSSQHQSRYQPELTRFRFINSLGEAIAHEDGHFKKSKHIKQRKSYGYEEIFTEYTSVFAQRETEGEVVNFRSVYITGALRLSEIIDEIIRSGYSEETVLRSVFGTAHTGILSDMFEINGIEVTGFASLYKIATGKDFADEMNKFSDSEYNKAREGRRKTRSILPPS